VPRCIGCIHTESTYRRDIQRLSVFEFFLPCEYGVLYYMVENNIFLCLLLYYKRDIRTS
jgi:hypothetical protein